MSIREVGAKHDLGKLRFDLVPIEEFEEIVRVITYGAEKYAPDNWQKVEKAPERYFAALMRHLIAYRKGETRDPESRLRHLAHVGCNVLFLLWFEREAERVQSLKK